MKRFDKQDLDEQIKYCFYCKSIKDSKICSDFSAIKFGDLKKIKSVANTIIKKIEQEIEGDNWFVVATPGLVPNTATLIGSEVARISKRKFIKFVLRDWQRPNHYLVMSPDERKEFLNDLIRNRHIYTKSSLKGKRVILIDDAVSSGEVVNYMKNVLNAHGVAEIKTFVYVKFKEKQNLEYLAGLYNYQFFGLKYVLKLLNNKNNPVLSRLLAVCIKLPEAEKLAFVRQISKVRKNEFIILLRKFVKIMPEGKNLIKLLESNNLND